MEHHVPDVGYYLTSSIVPQFYAWVEVGGKPLQIYGATESGKKSVAYIEAKEGKEFVICFADQRQARPEHSYKAAILIDGGFVDSYIIPNEDTMFCSGPDYDGRLTTSKGHLVSATSEQPYLFSKLKTTDSDELACNDEHVVKNLGAIQLRYQRGTNHRSCTPDITYTTLQPKLIHENAKKAQLSHQAAFGEVKPIPELTSNATCDWIDSSDSPFFQIEFRYRSRQLLQVEGHIPNSPTPSPEPSPSPAVSPASPISPNVDRNRSTSAAQPSPSPQLENHDAEHIARLQAELDSLRRQERIAALEREIAGLQGGVGGAPSSSSRKIKAEPSELREDVKRVKKEIVDATSSQPSSQSKNKAKGKKKAEEIVLSDSD